MIKIGFNPWKVRAAVIILFGTLPITIMAVQHRFVVADSASSQWTQSKVDAENRAKSAAIERLRASCRAEGEAPSGIIVDLADYSTEKIACRQRTLEGRTSYRCDASLKGFCEWDDQPTAQSNATHASRSGPMVIHLNPLRPAASPFTARHVIRPGPSTNDVALSLDGHYLAVKDGNTLEVYDIGTGRLLGRNGTVLGCCALGFSPDDRYILIGGAPTFDVLDVPSLRFSKTYYISAFYQGPGAVSPGGRLLAVTASNGSVEVHDISGTGGLAFSPDRKRTFGGCQGLAKLAFSPDGRYLAAACSPLHGENSVLMWDLTTGQIAWNLPILEPDQGILENLTFSSDGRFLMALCDIILRPKAPALENVGPQVFIWDINAAKEVRTVNLPRTAWLSANEVLMPLMLSVALNSTTFYFASTGYPDGDVVWEKAGVDLPHTPESVLGAVVPGLGRPSADEAQTAAAAISQIVEGPHSTLPAPQAIGTNSSGVTTTTIRNGTRYTLSVYLSGPSAHVLTLMPGGSQMVTLAPGSYEEAARVSNPSVLPFYGKQDYSAGTAFSENFYITTGSQ